MSVDTTKPVAWAVFAENGNIRLWSQDCETARKFADMTAQPLVPLYAGDEVERLRAALSALGEGP